MFITITNASGGKPFRLEQSIDNSCCKQIGIRNISMWVGWYNIYEEQTWRWAKPVENKDSTEVKIKPGLYKFSELVEVLTNEIENFTIIINPQNGLIDMSIPPGYQIWLPDAVRYLLGLDDENWLSSAEYGGDRVVEFSPKRILIYLKQLSTTNNYENKNQRLEQSQLLGVIPISSESFGGYSTINFENPHFKTLSSGSINELDFDFKIEWVNGVRHKLDNHSQPIDLVLEIK